MKLRNLKFKQVHPSCKVCNCVAIGWIEELGSTSSPSEISKYIEKTFNIKINPRQIKNHLRKHKAVRGSDIIDDALRRRSVSLKVKDGKVTSLSARDLNRIRRFVFKRIGVPNNSYEMADDIPKLTSDEMHTGVINMSIDEGNLADVSFKLPYIQYYIYVRLYGSQSPGLNDKWSNWINSLLDVQDNVDIEDEEDYQSLYENNYRVIKKYDGDKLQLLDQAFKELCPSIMLMEDKK